MSVLDGRHGRICVGCLTVYMANVIMIEKDLKSVQLREPTSFSLMLEEDKIVLELFFLLKYWISRHPQDRWRVQCSFLFLTPRICLTGPSGLSFSLIPAWELVLLFRSWRYSRHSVSFSGLPFTQIAFVHLFLTRPILSTSVCNCLIWVLIQKKKET